jgi:hypothetical protein
MFIMGLLPTGFADQKKLTRHMPFASRLKLTRPDIAIPLSAGLIQYQNTSTPCQNRINKTV